jgi:hypothetical protein
LLDETQIILRKELFRRNSKFYGCVVIKTYMIRSYLDYNIVVIQKILMVIASLLEKMSGKSTPLLDPSSYINIV